MRRVLPPILPLALVAGCGGALPPAGPAEELHAGFPPHGVADTIEVYAVERLPLRSAELVAPDGTATPASYVNVANSPEFATGQWATGNLWSQAVTPSNGIPAVATQNVQAAAAVRSEAALLATVSTADLPLPDPVAYRRDWTHYRIRLTFGTPPGEVETREIAAPPPPPPTSPQQP
jgi:hypothetical protein